MSCFFVSLAFISTTLLQKKLIFRIFSCITEGKSLAKAENVLFGVSLAIIFLYYCIKDIFRISYGLKAGEILAKTAGNLADWAPLWSVN